MAEQRPSGGGDAGDQVWIRYGESGRTIFEVVPVSLKQHLSRTTATTGSSGATVATISPTPSPCPPSPGSIGSVTVVGKKWGPTPRQPSDMKQKQIPPLRKAVSKGPAPRPPITAAHKGGCSWSLATFRRSTHFWGPASSQRVVAGSMHCAAVERCRDLIISALMTSMLLSRSSSPGTNIQSGGTEFAGPSWHWLLPLRPPKAYLFRG